MKKITITLVLLLFFKAGYAQTDTLLVYYRQKALDYQQRIKMAEHQLSGAESKVKASQSGRLPQIDFHSRYRYFGVPLQQAPSGDNPTAPGVEVHNFYSLNLDLYQPVLTGGYLKNTKRSAESETKMMEDLVSMNKQEVMINSDMMYWEAVSKKELYRLFIAYKENIGSLLKVIKDRVEEEIVGKNELYQAKVRYNQAEYMEIKSKKEYMVSIMNLNRLAGIPVNTPSDVADSLIVAEWSEAAVNITEQALKQRPELRYLENQISKYEYDEKIVGSKYYPQFGVTAGGKWGSPSPGLQIDPAFNYYLKAQLNIPIIHWGQRKEEVYTAHQYTEISKLQMEETRDRITQEVESSYYQLERSQDQLNFAKSSLKNATENVSVILDRYNEGLSSVLEVLEAERDWQKTYMNFILAKYELNVAYSQYLFAIGYFSQL